MTAYSGLKLQLMWWKALVGVLLLLVAFPAFAQPSFPKLTGRVVDEARLLNPQQSAALDARLTMLEQQTGHQLVVATIPDLQGYDIADYGYQLGRTWGLGQKETNDGALLIVAPKERRVRIEVGYGLEPLLTDAFSSRTIQDVILPHFKANDYPGGIAAGADAIAQQIALPPEEAAKRDVEAGRTQKARGRSVDGGAFIFWILVFLFVVVPMIVRASGGGRRYRGSGIGEAILWTAINAAANSRHSGGSSWGGGGGSSWGGGGGGGGFSGGGGSFGGGGASGGW